MKRISVYFGNIPSNLPNLSKDGRESDSFVVPLSFIDGKTQCRRSRRLVVSCVATVGNYEYGLFWYFQQDGTIQFEVKLTGSITPGNGEINGPPSSNISSL